MPLVDITKPEVIKFLLENYVRESNLRVNWNNKHGHLIEKAAQFNKEPKNHFDTDVKEQTMIEGMAAITRDSITAGFNRRKVPIRDGLHIPVLKDQQHGHSIVDVGLGDPKTDPRLEKCPSTLPNPIMRPVDPETKALIYAQQPSSKAKYLKERSKILPEDRYYFAECVNWDYAWRLKDSKASGRAVYGRTEQMQRTRVSRVGPQPDPHHYKSPEIPANSKCVE